MNQAKAFESIMKHEALIRRVCARVVKRFGLNLPSDGLDDLVRDVCLELASKRLLSYREDGGRSVKGWVAMTADCAAQNILKKYRYTEVYDCTDTDLDDDGARAGVVQAADQSTTEARAAALRETGRLWRALSELAPEDAELAEAMATGTERDYRDRHGLTPVQMSRAKARVRALLAAKLKR